MLRAAVAVAAGGGVIAAMLATGADPAAWPFLALALLIAAACIVERRYRGAAGAAPGDRFRPTSERFIDPESGRTIAVWTDPATGARRYVDEGEADPPPI